MEKSVWNFSCPLNHWELKSTLYYVSCFNIFFCFYILWEIGGGVILCCLFVYFALIYKFPLEIVPKQQTFLFCFRLPYLICLKDLENVFEVWHISDTPHGAITNALPAWVPLAVDLRVEVVSWSHTCCLIRVLQPWPLCMSLHNGFCKILHEWSLS